MTFNQLYPTSGLSFFTVHPFYGPPPFSTPPITLLRESVLIFNPLLPSAVFHETVFFWKTSFSQAENLNVKLLTGTSTNTTRGTFNAGWYGGKNCQKRWRSWTLQWLISLFS